MKVLIFDQQSDLEIEPASVKPIVKKVLENENRSTDEVSVYFVSTEEISRLHQDFFDDPTPTDCISFPMGEPQGTGYHILGEIFVCPRTALDFVLKFSEEISDDCYAETTLYLVHGLLHLLGYNDISDDDREKMRAAESRHMEALMQAKLLLKGD